MDNVNKILRVHSQSFKGTLQPIDYLKSMKINVLKYRYGAFGACLYIEVPMESVINSDFFETLEIKANRFNWDLL